MEVFISREGQASSAPTRAVTIGGKSISVSVKECADWANIATLMIASYMGSKNHPACRTVWIAGCCIILSYTGLGAMVWFVKTADVLKCRQLYLLRSLAIKEMAEFINIYVYLAGLGMSLGSSVGY